MSDPTIMRTKITLEFVEQGHGIDKEYIEESCADPIETMNSLLECVEFAKVTVEINGKTVLEQDPPKEKNDES